jgi:hypothetical protein
VTHVLDDEAWRSLPVKLELRDVTWSRNHKQFSGTYSHRSVEVAHGGDCLIVRTRFEPAPPFEKAFASDQAQRFDDVRPPPAGARCSGSRRHFANAERRGDVRAREIFIWG